MDLKATQSTGASAQTSTSSPQNATSNNNAGLTSSVQPTSQGGSLNTSATAATTPGVSLSPRQLPTVALQGTASGSTAPVAAPHHVNAFLVTASIVLFVLAIGLFMLTGRNEKNTTY